MQSDHHSRPFPADARAAISVAAAAFEPQPVIVIALLLAGQVAWTVTVDHREALHEPAT